MVLVSTERGYNMKDHKVIKKDGDWFHITEFEGVEKALDYYIKELKDSDTGYEEMYLVYQTSTEYHKVLASNKRG